MLVLSRKEGESLTIDGNITVTVFKLAGGKVRLGIEAPKDVSIMRSELPQWSTAPLRPFVSGRSVEINGASPCLASAVG
jgi:carbon storage regulator